MREEPPAPGSFRAWWFMLVAGSILMIAMGARQSMGLFVPPLDGTTGLGVAGISFAMAIGQFVWGASQPVFGVVADRWGPGRVIVVGAVLMAVGSVLTTIARSQSMLVLTLGVLVAAGAGAGSFSILIGATAQRSARSSGRGSAASRSRGRGVSPGCGGPTRRSRWPRRSWTCRSARPRPDGPRRSRPPEPG